MAAGGQTSYPSLETVANLVRSFVNDDKKGATGTAGEGQILTDASVTLQNFMNSAIRETYRDVRIMGQPTLIADNYILLNCPPVNSSLGVGAPNPIVQVSLAFTGFFDGYQSYPNLLLPNNLLYPLEVWQRQSGTNNGFGEVSQAKGALRPRPQGYGMGQWEWRQDSLWFNGSTIPMDLRLRYVFTFADLVSADIDWSTTYIPILDCAEVVADKIAVRYARRLGSSQLEDLKAQAQQSITRLRQQFTRTRQMIDFQIPMYGGNAGRAGRQGNTLY